MNPYIYALSAILMWSSVATAFKLTLSYTSLIATLFVAVLSSTTILALWLLWQKKLSLVAPYLKQNYKITLISGIINPFAYYLVLFGAYKLLTAQEAQAINYTWALVFAYMSVIFLSAKLRAKDIIAGIICYFGVLIIATKGDLLSLNFSNNLGVALAIISTILWSSYWVINSKNSQDEAVVLFSNMLFGLILITILLLFTKEYNNLNPKGVLGSIYIGLFEMGLAFLLWQKGLNLATNKSKIANLIFLSPPISLIFIATILKEKIEISTIFALVLIIFGLIYQQTQP